MQYREACFSQGEVAAGRSDRNPAAAAVGICVAFSIHWLRLVLSHNRELPRDRLAKMKRDSGGIDLLMQKIYMDEKEDTHKISFCFLAIKVGVLILLSFFCFFFAFLLRLSAYFEENTSS